MVFLLISNNFVITLISLSTIHASALSITIFDLVHNDNPKSAVFKAKQSFIPSPIMHTFPV